MAVNTIFTVELKMEYHLRLTATIIGFPCSLVEEIVNLISFVGFWNAKRHGLFFMDALTIALFIISIYLTWFAF